MVVMDATRLASRTNDGREKREHSIPRDGEEILALETKENERRDEGLETYSQH
jgi:hypothetical protein